MATEIEAVTNEEMTILNHFRGNIHNGAECLACREERAYFDMGYKKAITEVAEGR